MEVQTRNEEGAYIMHSSLKEAFEAAKNDKTIWKISFTISETNERVRLVLHTPSHGGPIWIYEPIMISTGEGN